MPVPASDLPNNSVPQDDLPITLPSNPYATKGGGAPVPVSTPQVGATLRQAAVPHDDLPTNPAAPPKPKPNSGGLVQQFSHTAQQVKSTLTSWESNVWGGYKEALGSGVDTALNVLGTPQREISGIAQAVEKGPLAGGSPLATATDFSDRMNTLNDLIWHPTPEKVNKARTAVQKGLHLSTDADIDTMMHGTLMHHLGQLSPYVSNALKTINNVSTDIITDPFALAGDAATAARDLGLGEALEAAPSAAHLLTHAAHAAAVNPATKPLIHAGVTAGRMITAQVHNLLVKHGAGPAFSHLKDAVTATKNSASNIHRGLVDTFVTRPDLIHAGLTPEGRDVRLQLENSQRVLKSKAFHEGGGDKMDEEAREALDKFHNKELARRSKEVFSQPGGKKLEKVPGTMNWSKYKAPDDTERGRIAQIAKVTSNIGRQGIELNPLPHGVGNVGTLQFLGGGLDAVTRGVASMVKPADEVVKGRLIQMGSAVPDYIGKGTFNIPGYKQAVNAMSGLLGQMEYGWRAGMLDHLDRVLGPSEAGSKAEYIKGALINKKLGDYHNQHAFARTFASMGGPFVMYKLGILPAAVIDSIKRNPLNFENVARTEQQVNKNRPDSAGTNLSFSDPVSETSRGVVDPSGYAFDTLSIAHEGLELYADWQNPGDTHETEDQGINRIAANHFAPLGMAEGALANTQGPNMSFTDHMAAMIIGSLNGHIHKKPSRKAEIKNQKYINKHAFTPED